jgi:hypothetical protein
MFGGAAPGHVTVPLAFRDVSAFYICGGILAGWALLVSFLGVTRENFPATKRAERAVGAISVLLVVGAIGSAVVSSAVEEEDEKELERQEEALLLPR